MTANSQSYGSFGNTNIKHTNEVYSTSEESNEVVDNDSGMSSEENDDSLRYDASATSKNNVSQVSSSLNNKQEVIIKCLMNEPQCAQHRNEIPCCSNNITNLSVIVEDESSRLCEGGVAGNEVPEFIVIDVTCDVSDSIKSEGRMGNSRTVVECDNLHSLGSSQSLVPVNNEIVRSENQKLVSLSLSILLAALLQAMRCFAQFLEDIVVPHR